MYWPLVIIHIRWTVHPTSWNDEGNFSYYQFSIYSHPSPVITGCFSIHVRFNQMNLKKVDNLAKIYTLKDKVTLAFDRVEFIVTEKFKSCFTAYTWLEVKLYKVIDSDYQFRLTWQNNHFIVTLCELKPTWMSYPCFYLDHKLIELTQFTYLTFI